jgi:hypothetical protein
MMESLRPRSTEEPCPQAPHLANYPSLRMTQTIRKAYCRSTAVDVWFDRVGVRTRTIRESPVIWNHWIIRARYVYTVRESILAIKFIQA